MHHLLAFLGRLCRDNSGRASLTGCWPGLPTRDQAVGFERVCERSMVVWEGCVRGRLKLDAFIHDYSQIDMVGPSQRIQ